MLRLLLFLMALPVGLTDGVPKPSPNLDGSITSNIMAFRLPDLPEGHVIESATFTFTVIERKSMRNREVNDGSVSLDLRGAKVDGSRSTSWEDIRAGEVIASGFVSPFGALTVGTHSVSTAGMAQWLNANYAAGEYAFLVLAPSSPFKSSVYFEMHSANITQEDLRPTLKLVTIPESSVLRISFVLSLLGLLHRRK